MTWDSTKRPCVGCYGPTPLDPYHSFVLCIPCERAWVEFYVGYESIGLVKAFGLFVMLRRNVRIAFMLRAVAEQIGSLEETAHE